MMTGASNSRLPEEISLILHGINLKLSDILHGSHYSAKGESLKVSLTFPTLQFQY